MYDVGRQRSGFSAGNHPWVAAGRLANDVGKVPELEPGDGCVSDGLGDEQCKMVATESCWPGTV